MWLRVLVLVSVALVPEVDPLVGDGWPVVCVGAAVAFVGAGVEEGDVGVGVSGVGVALDVPEVAGSGVGGDGVVEELVPAVPHVGGDVVAAAGWLGELGVVVEDGVAGFGVAGDPGGFP